jgi:hypothetical protein
MVPTYPEVNHDFFMWHRYQISTNVMSWYSQNYQEIHSKTAAFSYEIILKLLSNFKTTLAYTVLSPITFLGLTVNYDILKFIFATLYGQYSYMSLEVTSLLKFRNHETALRHKNWVIYNCFFIFSVFGTTKRLGKYFPPLYT